MKLLSPEALLKRLASTDGHVSLHRLSAARTIFQLANKLWRDANFMEL